MLRSVASLAALDPMTVSKSQALVGTQKAAAATPGFELGDLVAFPSTPTRASGSFIRSPPVLTPMQFPPLPLMPFGDAGTIGVGLQKDIFPSLPAYPSMVKDGVNLYLTNLLHQLGDDAIEEDDESGSD